MFKKALLILLNIGKIFLLLAIFLALFLIYERVIFSFGFTDEGDNISIGKYLLEGKVLYKDIFSQHQPLTYFFSALVQKVSQPPSILMVVKRHRQAVMLFSYLWISFLSFRFGFWILVPFVIFELTKYYLLGHLFLAEALTPYPLVYLFLLAWVVLHKKNLSLLDCFLAPIFTFLIAFTLLPLVPLSFFLFSNLVFAMRFRKGTVLTLTVPFLLLSLFLFSFLPAVFYFEGTIWANIFYYIPLSNKIAFQIEEPWYVGLAKIFFYPLTSFFNLQNPYFRILALITLVFIISSFLLIRKFKATKLVIFSTLVLILANLRPPVGTGIFYHAFHSLPYVSLLIVVSFTLLKEVIGRVEKRGEKVLVLLPLFFLMLIFLFDSRLFYREKISPKEQEYIEFSRIFDYSVAARTLAAPGDTLAVVPYEELLYWYSDVEPATRFLFYYSWVYDVPKFKKEIDQSLEKNPPTFIYWVTGRLDKFFKDEDYLNLPRDATHSALFIHKKKIPKIAEERWRTLEYYRFGRIKEKAE